MESPIKIDKNNNNKENIINHNNYIREILYSSGKKDKNKNLIDENKEEKKIEDKNNDIILDKKNQLNVEQNLIKKEDKDNIQEAIEQKNEDINITKKINQDKDEKEEKKVNLKNEESYDKLSKNEIKQLSSSNCNDDKLLTTDNQKTYKNSIQKLFNLKINKNDKEENFDKISQNQIKQLSVSNYNDDKLLTTENQKTYKNSIQKLFNLKIGKNNIEEKMFKEHSVYESYNNYLQLKKYNKMNINANYLNTEIYPKDSRILNKIDYYNFKLINKKSLLDNKITFNNIIKTLQNQEYFKSKTPSRYTFGQGVIVKKGSVLSDTIVKAKEKYNSHSPGFSKFAKINNDIHIKIKKN
jgi:hypothetical protein